MRIAVTTEPADNTIFQHFGHTEVFTIFEAEDGKITSKEVISSNGSGHGALGDLLAEHKADVLICGGIGEGARRVLAEVNIELVGGAKGDVEEAVKSYLAGSLKNDPAGKCDHHHDHEHGEGHECGHHGGESDCGHGTHERCHGCHNN